MSIKNLFQSLSPFHFKTANAVNFNSDIQRSYTWHLIIPKLPAQIDTGLTSLVGEIAGERLGALASGLDNIKRSAQLVANCKSVNLPKVLIETTPAYFFGRKREIPVAVSYEDNKFEVIFEERENQVVLTTFNRWINMVMNAVTKSGNSIFQNITNLLNVTKTELGMNFSDFDKWATDIFVVMEGTGGLPTSIYKIIKAVPVNINPTQSLDYSSNASVTYTVTFVFNEFVLVTREDLI